MSKITFKIICFAILGFVEIGAAIFFFLHAATDIQLGFGLVYLFMGLYTLLGTL